MNKTIKDFTETELKAMAYDQLATIEQAQIVIKAINQELQARAGKTPVEEVTPPKEEEKKDENNNK